LKRLGSFGIAASLTLLAFAAIPTPIVTYPHRRVVIVIWTIVSAALISVRVFVAERKIGPPTVPPRRPSRRRAQFSKTTSESVTPEYLVYAKRVFKERFGVDCLPHLAGIMSDPAGHLVRITEQVSFSSTRTSHTVVRTVLSPGDGLALIPVMRPQKGHLVDDLRVSIDNRSVSTLSFLESTGAMALVLELLFRYAFPPSTSTTPKNVSDIASDISVLCASVSPLGKNDRARLKSLLADLDWVSTHAITLRYKRALENLIEYLKQSYVIVVALPHCREHERVKLTVEHHTPRPEVIGSLSNRVRTMLGLTLRSYAVCLPHAAEAPSYHFRVSSPEGTYFYRALAVPAIVSPHEEQMPLQAAAPDGRPVMPKILQSHPRGQNVMHVYGRDLLGHLHDYADKGSWSENKLALQFYGEYRERPPGVLATVLPVSLYLVVLAWGIGHFHNIVFPLQATPQAKIPLSGVTNAAWPALLFSIPTLVSGWLVVRLTADSVQRMSLSTLFILLWQLVNAAAAVGIAALKISRPDRTTLHLIGDVTVTHVSWACIMLSTATQFFLGCVMLVSKTLRYWRSISRKS
jgi:hypothetical protein